MGKDAERYEKIAKDGSCIRECRFSCDVAMGRVMSWLQNPHGKLSIPLVRHISAKYSQSFHMQCHFTCIGED